MLSGGRILFTLVLSFLMICSVTGFQASLDQGWNLISGPQSFHASQIQEQCEIQSVGGKQIWGHVNGSWTHPEILSSRQGYFVNLESSCDLFIDSINDNVEPRNLRDGWNLVSNSVSGSWRCEDFRSNLWRFEEGSWDKLSSPTGMETNTGYWMRGDSCSYNRTAGNRTILIEGTGEKVNYEFRVDKWVEKKGSADPGDVIDGKRVTGATLGGLDAYNFETKIEDFEINGEANLYLDGVEVEVSELASNETKPDEIPDKPGIYPRMNYSEMDQYYVSPSGSDNAAGTLNDPWSVDAAEENAQPGDVVNFMDGTYSVGRIYPPNGEEGAPVVFRAQNRHQAVIEGDEYTFTLEDSSHVHIQGFRIDAFDWVDITDSDHITVRDNYMTGHPPMLVVNSDQIKVLNNNMKRGGDHNMFFVRNSDHMLVSGNSFSRAGHNPSGFFWGFENVAWRGNVCHNVIGRSCGFKDGENVVVEDNLFSSSWDSPKSGAAAGKWEVDSGIFRFNKLYRNWGTPVTITTPPLTRLRVYNNVWSRMLTHDGDSNYGDRGIVFFDRDESQGQIQAQIENNIFDVKRDAEGIYVIGYLKNELTDIDVTSNLFDGSTVIRQQSKDYSLEEAEQTYPENYFKNIEGASGFNDPQNGDFSLTQESDAIDAGKFLTRTTSAGEGSTIPVEDARYFHDGLGIDGFQGDVIQVGDVRARVTEVDWEADSITVAEGLSWDSDTPVSLPWTGSSPDIGAVQSGGSNAHIVVKAPERARVGKEVSFEASIKGEIDVREICWQFGDGQGKCGASVSHEYQDPYDYGVRARLIDSDGRIHWGTHYIFVSNDETETYSIEYRTSECEKFMVEEQDKEEC